MEPNLECKECGVKAWTNKITVHCPRCHKDMEKIENVLEKDKKH